MIDGLIYFAFFVAGAVAWHFIISTRERNEKAILKIAQNELIKKVNETLGAHQKNLTGAISEGTKSLMVAARSYNKHASDYFNLKSGLAALVCYHVYTTGTTRLHQSHKIDKVENWVSKELKKLENLDSGEYDYASTVEAAHQAEQRYRSLYGRIKSGGIQQREFVYRCQECKKEIDLICPECSGVIERRFVKQFAK